jgi:WD40 repeat protein
MASRSILLDLPTGVVRDVAFHPDGTRFATANDDNTARIWDTISRTDVLTLPRRHSNVVYGVAFSPDGKKLATASWDRTVIVWDAASGEWLQTFHHTAGVYRVAFSPDGRSLATASVDNKVNVYLLDVEDLMAFARTRVTRSLTSMER